MKPSHFFPLDELPLTDLKAEIELIRVMNSRFHESLKSVTQSLDTETQLSALQVVTLSAQAINLSAQAITSLICLQNLCTMEKNNEEIMKYISSIQDDKLDDFDTPS